MKITELMQSVARLAVPLVVEVGVGDNWDKAHSEVWRVAGYADGGRAVAELKGISGKRLTYLRVNRSFRRASLPLNPLRKAFLD